MSGSTQCPHSDVHYHLNLAAFGNTNIRYLELKGACTICGSPIIFRGPVGLAPDQPRISLGGEEISLPLMFGTEEYDGKATGYTLEIHR